MTLSAGKTVLWGSRTALVGALLLGTLGCPPASPVLTVSPSEIVVDETANAASLSVLNTGGGNLVWSASCSAEWATLTPDSGTGDGTILLTIDRTALRKAPQSSSIEVASNGGSAVVPVTVMDDPINPVLSLSTNILDFATVATEGSFTIQNTGGGTLTWSAGSYASWVTLSETSGTAPATISVLVNRTQLSPGVNSTVVAVTSNGGTADLTISAVWTDAPGGPVISSLSPYSNVTFEPTASVGDEVRIAGSNFSPAASENIVSFNGVETPGSRYESQGGIDGILYAVAPEGATTGPLKARVNGSSAWSNEVVLTIVPATEITLAAGWEDAGVYLPLVTVSAGDRFRQSWVLSGSRFLAVDEYRYGAGLGLEVNGTIHINATIGGTLQTSCYVWPISDTQVMIPWIPDEAVASVEDSGVLEVRVVGREKETGAPRFSNTLTLEISEDPYIDAAYHVLHSRTFGTYPYSWDPATPLEIPRGDWLFLAQVLGDDTLRCPALWSGELTFGGDGIAARRFRMTTQGTFEIENLTDGTTKTIVVKDEGVPYEAVSPQPPAARSGVGAQIESDEDSVVLGCGGARVIVPPGAIPLDEGRVGVALYYDRIPDSGVFDPEVSDGRRICRVSFTHPDTPDDGWELTRLNGPITIEVPFTLEGIESGVAMGAFDADSGLYYSLSATIDMPNRKAILTLPAGDYTPAEILKADGGGLPPVSVNSITRRLGVPYFTSSSATLTDPAAHFNVIYITDPASDSYVSDQYAEELLAIMVDAYDNLAGQGWREPTSAIEVNLRSWALLSGYGETSKGVFGQPYVGINIAQCPQGSAAFYTTAAHETGHVFQRQYTTNISTKWFDEAAAEWAAFDSVGSFNFATEAVNDTVAFVHTLPNGFYFGFNSGQSYAASPWPIWMDKTYSGSILKVYESLEYSPLNWTDSYGVFQEATGKTMAEMYQEFAEYFWLQQEVPFTDAAYDGSVQTAINYNPVLTMTGYGALTTPNVVQPAMSSIRYTMGIGAPFMDAVLGRDIVLRTSGLTGLFPQIRAFRATGNPTLPPTAPVKLTTLDEETTSALLGQVSAGTHYRLILTNADRSNTASIRATLVVPNISSLSPASGVANGGYTVTVSGSGFGDTQGQILFSGSPVGITSWNDSTIQFIMPSAGVSSSWNLNVRTAEDAVTNSVVFAFTD